MDNQLIHEWVMGKCWHNVDCENPEGIGYFYCHTCKSSVSDGGNPQEWHRNHLKVDYSDPTNYEALSSKFREWGEWGNWQVWWVKQHSYQIMASDWWENKELADRVTLIADYIRSKGVEYWDIRRKG